MLAFRHGISQRCLATQQNLFDVTRDFAFIAIIAIGMTT